MWEDSESWNAYDDTSQGSYLDIPQDWSGGDTWQLNPNDQWFANPTIPEYDTPMSAVDPWQRFDENQMSPIPQISPEELQWRQQAGDMFAGEPTRFPSYVENPSEGLQQWNGLLSPFLGGKMLSPMDVAAGPQIGTTITPQDAFSTRLLTRVLDQTPTELRGWIDRLMNHPANITLSSNPAIQDIGVTTSLMNDKPSLSPGMLGMYKASGDENVIRQLTNRLENKTIPEFNPLSPESNIKIVLNPNAVAENARRGFGSGENTLLHELGHGHTHLLPESRGLYLGQQARELFNSVQGPDQSKILEAIHMLQNYPRFQVPSEYYARYIGNLFFNPYIGR